MVCFGSLSREKLQSTSADWRRWNHWFGDHYRAVKLMSPASISCRKALCTALTLSALRRCCQRAQWKLKRCVGTSHQRPPLCRGTALLEASGELFSCRRTSPSRAGLVCSSLRQPRSAETPCGLCESLLWALHFPLGYVGFWGR